MAKAKTANKINKKVKSSAKSIASVPFSLIRGIIRLPKTILAFLRSVRNELKEVDWLSPRSTAKWSLGVIATTIVFAALITLLDFGFFELRNILLNI